MSRLIHEARFAAFLAEGKFMIQRSKSTGAYVFYPRVFAPRTGAADLEWVEASGDGVVYATTCNRYPADKGGDVNIALIDLAEGPRMMSRVEGGRIAPGGALPVNTNGGGLSCVHPGMYGLFVMIEAIRQIRRAGGDDEGHREPGGWIDGVKLSLAHGNGGVLSSQVTSIWGAVETL